MANGLNSVILKRAPNCETPKSGVGSRRIFAPQFKLQVLDSYRNDADCKGNQRATARKYGIHRRQIQKWLQMETNLRNSVIKQQSGLTKQTNGIIQQSCPVKLELSVIKQEVCGLKQIEKGDSEARKCGPEMALSGHTRQRDDTSPVAYTTASTADPVAYLETTCAYRSVCSPSPLRTQTVAAALDYSTRARVHDTFSYEIQEECLCYPMDLSVKKTYDEYEHKPIVLHEPPIYTHLYCSPQKSNSSPVYSQDTFLQPETRYLEHENRVWDLSLKRKIEDCHKENHISSSADEKSKVDVEGPPVKQKPVKLFKPYLDDDDYNCKDTKSNQMYENSWEDKIIKEEPVTSQSYCTNNNVIENKELLDVSYSSYSPVYYGNVCPSGYIPHQYEQDSYSIEKHSDDYNMVMKNVTNSIKQRQSYSLNFKLSAIECYYNDALCRGNQRAVANKYKIHRRQIQKWLKQQDELRERILPVSRVHAVS